MRGTAHADHRRGAYRDTGLEDPLVNSAYLHLALNHIPIITTLIGLLLLAAAIFWRKSADLTGAALALLVLGALVAIPTYRTGEPAEEIVEELPGISHETIHDHEEAAETAVWAVGLAGVAAAGGLIWLRRRGSAPSWLLVVTLVLALVATVLLARTATLGGLIRHSEIAAVQCGWEAPYRSL